MAGEAEQTKQDDLRTVLPWASQGNEDESGSICLELDDDLGKDQDRRKC